MIKTGESYYDFPAKVGWIRPMILARKRELTHQNHKFSKLEKKVLFSIADFSFSRARYMAMLEFPVDILGFGSVP